KPSHYDSLFTPHTATTTPPTLSLHDALPISTGFLNVATGSHTVSETGHGTTSLSDYDSSVSCDNGDANTAPAESRSLATSNPAYCHKRTCTTTNHQLPQLKVVKSLVPSGDGGLFNLMNDSSSYDNSRAFPTRRSSDLFLNVATGSHTVSETGHGTTSLSDYDSSVSCDNGDANTAPA